MDHDWLGWARRLQALAQTGLTYARNPYDVERYEAVRAIAAEIMAGRAGVGVERVEALFAGQAGYATPKVDVRGAVFDGDRVLLVQEASDGLWTLPGGWADVQQTPAEAVVREIREESGFETVARKLAAVYDRDRQGHTPHAFHIYKLFFVCERVGGAARPSVETSAVDFFALDALPPLSIDRITPRQIARMHRHWRDPALPTEFD